MRAVVMAGGQGSRLRPLTSNQPKPMLPVVGRPMMEHILKLARKHGFTDIVATVQFLASVVRNYFGDGSDLGVSLSYATEEEPLGTAGSVKNAAPLLDERTLVVSGDALTDVDLTELIRRHESTGAAVTVTLARVPNPLEFGIVITDGSGQIERFQEKPGWGDVFSDTINTGIYVLEREAIDLIPDGEAFDFSQDLFPLLLDKGFPMFGYVTDRYWTDVGNLHAYLAAHRDVLDGKVEVEIEGFQLQDGVWLGDGAEVHPEANVQGPAFIGAHSRVEGGATLRDYTVLGRGVMVKSGAFLHRSVIHDYVYAGPSSSLRGCVVGKNTDIKSGGRVEEGAVVADECHIGAGAVIQPQVKVYPFKSVDPGAIVSKSIIWQTGGARSLFGERGVSGLFNIDMTPEMALRLALAYASLLPKGSSVVASRDATRAARVIKRAMVAGINAGGIDCDDLELVPTPVGRFYARSARAVGGFAIRTAAMDPSSIEVQFFDQRGVDIGTNLQRKLERAYYRDDLRRAFHHDIGELNLPARGRDLYARGLLEAVNLETLRERRWKVVVDCAFGSASLTVPHVLGRLDGDVLTVAGVLDEERLIHSAEDTERHLDELERLVRGSGAEVGALIDSTGERLLLVDGSGHRVDGRSALLAFVWLVAQARERARVALPVSTSRVAEQIVRDRGGEVTWTPVASAGLMEAAAECDASFAGDEEGGYVFPSFQPGFDALMGLVKLLELLTTTRTSLVQVLESVPPAHIASRDVLTPWEAKGTVMRRLIERLNGGPVVTIDGVKTFRGQDWALVVPHPQEPLVRVWAEGGSQDAAAALADEFAALVEELRA
jgi:mannose-1-phosphate guanylyltransferase / phosphomannomutase